MNSRHSVISPKIPLLILACIGFASMGIMLVFPEEGLGSGAWKLKFKTWNSLFAQHTESKIENVEDYLAMLDSASADTLSLSVDTLKVKRVTGKTSLQFLNDDASRLYAFFEALDETKASGKNLHVLHFGDSQIETDRITGYLRQQWQAEFGGRGPGLVSPIPITPNSNIKQTQSDNWERYTAFGFDNGKAAHNRYGIMAAFGRFTRALDKADIDSGNVKTGWIELRPSVLGHGNVKNYSQARIYFGNHKFDLVLSVSIGDSTFACDTLAATSGIIRKTYHFNSTPAKLRFTFTGADSPDVHGICLQDAGGVNVDNLALRGSNGNIFKRISSSELRMEMDDLNTQLIMLQFGGNAMPYVSGEKSAADYGNFFQSQIQYLKTIAPHASFIVIGPSDMSKMIDGTWQTYPYLENVRDALKQAAFNEGCGFWDLYEVMGGKNSMVSWVNNSPQFAGSDHIHFTPLGARKVSELLYKAIKNEYDAWKNASVK